MSEWDRTEENDKEEEREMKRKSEIDWERKVEREGERQGKRHPCRSIDCPIWELWLKATSLENWTILD